MKSFQSARQDARFHLVLETYGPLLYLFGLLALTLYLSLRDYFSYQFGYTPDSVEYTLLAHALIKGPVFALNYSTVQPEPTHFPFGYPLLLIPFVVSAPDAFRLPAVLSLGATLASVAILFFGWHILVPEVDRRWRYPVTAMFALAPTTLIQTRLVLSEAVFTTALLLTLFFAARSARQPARRSLWFALGVAAFFMIFTRSIGLVSLAAILLYLWIRLGKQAFAGSLILGTTIVLLTSAVLATTPVKPGDLLPGDYLRWYVLLGPVRGLGPMQAPPPGTPSPPVTQPITAEADQNSAVTLDVRYIVLHVNEDLRRMLLLSGGGDQEMQIVNRLGAPWLAFLPALFALGLMFVGLAHWASPFWRTPRQPISAFLLVGVIYFLVVMFWRGSGERLWYPIAPQLFLAYVLGLFVICRRLGQIVPQFLRRADGVRAGATAVGVLLTLWLALAVYRDLTLRSSYEMWGDLDARAAALKRYLPPGGIIASDWPAYDFLYSGREMAQIGAFSSADALLASLRQHNISAVVIATDETFTRLGNTRRGTRTSDTANLYRELVERKVLTRVHSDPYPFQIFLVNGNP